MRKRIFSLLTALALCLSLLPATASAADHDHTDGTWTALTAGTTTLSGGKYYLSEDVTCSGGDHTPITVTGTVTLCLNGHVLDLSGQYIRVEGDLTLCDCNSTGQTHKFTVGTNGLWTWNDAATGENVQSLPGGVITGGDGTDLTSGGVYVYDGSFTMTGGSIAGNTASVDGGGVYVYDGSGFTMEGGTISGNKASVT